MDYNKLKTLVVISETNSISSAARKLQRSQSAISQQIQALESELELKLLERKGGKIYLSKDGDRLVQIAINAFSSIDDGFSAITHKKLHLSGNIKLGVLNNNAVNINLEEIIASFCKLNPKVNVSVIYGTSDEIEQKLIENKIDIGMLVYFKNPEMFIRFPIQKAFHRIYTSKVYLKMIGNISNSKQILNANLVDISEDFACFQTWFRKNSPSQVSSLLHRKPNVVIPDHRAIAEIVSNGYGIALIPDYIAQSNQFKTKLTEVMSSSKPVSTGLDVAYRTHKSTRLAERLFIENLKSRILSL